MEDYIKGIILESVFTSDQFVADYVKDCDCWVVKHNDNNIHDYWIISYDFDINSKIIFSETYIKQEFLMIHHSTKIYHCFLLKRWITLT